MSEIPAPPEEGAAPFRPTWHQLYLHCLAERDRFEIMRAHCAGEGGIGRAARHARAIAIYETLMRLVENCEKSPTIVDELRRMAAMARAAEPDADGEVGGE